MRIVSRNIVYEIFYTKKATDWGLTMKVEMDYVQTNQKVDKGTTSHRANTPDRMSGAGAYTLDISGTVMDNSAYKGQGKTAEDVKKEASVMNVATMRDYMTVMSNSMSEEDFAALKEDGFPIGTVDSETIVTVVDKIKAELLKAGVEIEGYTNDLDTAKIKEIAGSTAMADLIGRKLKEYDLPLTKENYATIENALQKAEKIEPLTEGTTKYMVENQLDPTVENLYKAQFSASEDANRQAKGYFAEGTQGYYGKKAESYDWEALRPQMEKVIKEAGEEVNENTMDTAKWLVEKGIPLTEENVTFLSDLKKLELPKELESIIGKMAASIANGRKAEEANLFNQSYYLKEAITLKEAVNEISEEAIEEAVAGSEAGSITLKDILAKQQTGNNNSNQNQKQNENQNENKKESDALITAKRQLEEIRLKMTVEANLKLLKKGISIETQELSALVEALKKEETNFNSALWEETLQKSAEIQKMPAAIVKELTIFPRTITLNEIHEQGNAQKKSYQEAQRNYETVMTEPRKDFGDSIQKAFRNVDDILKEMNLEVNEFNQRAVRILGYNHMEINEKNIMAIKEADLSLQRVLKQMTPYHTHEMIKKGINPLETSFEKLEENLKQIVNENKQEVDQYAKYLYKLEQNDQIKKEEKEAYIGIYRLIRQIEKSDGAVIGSLVNQGADISFKNLLSAVRSNKQKGMNVTINDSFGALQESNTRDNTISQQITNYYNKLADEIGEKLEPEKVAHLKITAETSLEQMAEMLNAAEGSKEIEVNYQQEELQEFQKAKNTEEYILKTLSDYSQPITLENITSAEALMNMRGEMYRQIDQFSKKMEELPSEENMLQKIEHTWEKLTDKETVNQAFEQMKQAVEQMVEWSVEVGSMDAKDMKAIALLSKQISFANHMAKEENYEIPVKVGEELTSVNLKILYQRKEAPKVSITMQTEMFGKAAAEFSVNDKKVNGLIVCEKNDHLEKLKALEVVFRKQNKENGMEGGEIHFAESKKLNINTFSAKEQATTKENTEAVSTKELYQIAKSFIYALQNA